MTAAGLTTAPCLIPDWRCFLPLTRNEANFPLDLLDHSKRNLAALCRVNQGSMGGNIADINGVYCGICSFGLWESGKSSFAFEICTRTQLFNLLIKLRWPQINICSTFIPGSPRALRFTTGRTEFKMKVFCCTWRRRRFAIGNHKCMQKLYKHLEYFSDNILFFALID
jgi:hypothetical protein